MSPPPLKLVIPKKNHRVESQRERLHGLNAAPLSDWNARRNAEFAKLYIGYKLLEICPVWIGAIDYFESYKLKRDDPRFYMN